MFAQAPTGSQPVSVRGIPQLLTRMDPPGDVERLVNILSPYCGSHRVIASVRQVHSLVYRINDC